MGSQATHIELDIVIDCAPFGKRELSARERDREGGRGRGEELERIVCETDFIVTRELAANCHVAGQIN